MWLSDIWFKRPCPAAAIVLSLLSCVFGVVSFDKIEPRSALKENR